MSESLRRLPIYLVLDCSESMAGEAIQEVSRGVDTMLDTLRSDPQALETAFISVITFSSYAKQAVPLTELMDFRAPTLSVRTGTALGSALNLVEKCIDREVRRTTAKQKGDYKPLVILLTDGDPTDEWEDAARSIKERRQPSIANIYAIGCGPDADTNILHEITDIVLAMRNMTQSTWKNLFVWLTASVQTTSRALETGGEGQSINLPSLPENIEVAPRSTGRRDPRPRQVFLHGFCSKSGQPYLMRYSREPYEDTYTAVRSHPLDPVDENSVPSTDAINTSLLDGVPACPHCYNPGASVCDCGAVICIGPSDQVVRCPRCHTEGYLTDGSGGFDVQQAQG